MRYIVILMVMLWTSIGFAATWELISGNDVDKEYIDTESIKVYTVGTNDIAKAKIKAVHSDSKYDLGYYKVDLDSKRYSLYQWESYENDVMTQQIIPAPRWLAYDPRSDAVREILSRAK